MPCLPKMTADSAKPGTGKIQGSGFPPAKEIIPGFFVYCMSSRIGEGFKSKAVAEKSSFHLISFNAIPPGVLLVGLKLGSA